MDEDEPTATVRPVALVTGVGRRIGIGAAIAERLAADGYDVGVTSWSGYDERMPWGRDVGGTDSIVSLLRALDARVHAVEADLGLTDAPREVFAAIERELGPVVTLVLCQCESVAAGIVRSTPSGRLGTATDTANLVSFICSPEGGWVNGQLLRSDGGHG